jgi:hypothetical protein
MGSSFTQAVGEARSGSGRILALLSLTLCAALALFAAPAAAADPTSPEPLAAAPAPPADAPVTTTPAVTPEPAPAAPQVVAAVDVPDVPQAEAVKAPVIAAATSVTTQVGVSQVAQLPRPTVDTAGVSKASAPKSGGVLSSATDELSSTRADLPAQVAKAPAIPDVSELLAIPALPELASVAEGYSGAGGPAAMGRQAALQEIAPISITVSRIGAQLLGGTITALQDELLAGASIGVVDQAAADSSPAHPAAGGEHGPIPDRAPAPLPVSGSPSPTSSGFYFFGFAALLVGLFGLRAPALSRRLANAPDRWQPVPYLALLERPG